MFSSTKAAYSLEIQETQTGTGAEVAGFEMGKRNIGLRVFESVHTIISVL